MERFDLFYALHGLLSSHKHPVALTHIMEELECAKSSAKRLIGKMRLYLDAWCHLRNEFRTFAVERIEHAHELKHKAKRISENELNNYFSSAFGLFSGAAKHTAVLHFTPERARWVAEEQWHPQQQSTWLDNGYYELRLPYGNPTELIMDILKYGSDVEVIKPASLRNTVKRKIRCMSELYQ